MLLPDYLKAAVLLNSPATRSQALESLASEGPDRSSETLRALLPYLSLPTLLSLRTSHKHLGQVVTETLYDLIDAQRDWVVSPECPAELRDSYLVHVFGKEWSNVKTGLDDVASGELERIRERLVLDASKFARDDKAQTCADLNEFRDKLKKATGGLLEKVNWNNVVLGGGAVLSILTGKGDTPAYASSDVDLFLVGLSPDQIVPKVRSLIQQIKSALPPKPKPTVTKYSGSFFKGNYHSEEVEVDETDPNWRAEHAFDWDEQYPGELLLIKGFNAFTIVPPDNVSPRRSIQIVASVNQSVFDALAWFDLDCCAVGYTGDSVVAVPRAVRSLSLGKWIGGVNFFDPKLGRKGDPTSSTASSRAVKYLQRGFSLALPSAALNVLGDVGLNYAELVAAGKKEAAEQQLPRSEPDLSMRRTHELAGLAGLLRREAIVQRKLKSAKAIEDGKPIEADDNGDVKLDYGYRNASWIKTVSEAFLKYSGNGTIAHEFREYAAKDVATAMENLLIDVDKAAGARSKKLPGAPRENARGMDHPVGIDRPYADYVVPYAAGFDVDFALGYKDVADDPFQQKWTQIRDLQYFIKLPTKLLPLIDKAEQTMRDVIAGKSTTLPAGDVGKSLPAVSESLREPIEQLFAKSLLSVAPGPSAQTAALDRFVPDSFPGAYRCAAPSSRHFFQKKAPVQHGVKNLFSPLSSPDGREFKPSKDKNHVYRVVTLAGLWQFKGLAPEIDAGLQVIWQAWTATVRAAMTLPHDLPFLQMADMSLKGFSLEDARRDLLDPKSGIARIVRGMKQSDRDLAIKWLEQSTTKEVFDTLNRELDQIDRIVQAEMKRPEGQAVGEWDVDRKRFLHQWIAGKEMV